MQQLIERHMRCDRLQYYTIQGFDIRFKIYGFDAA